MKGRLPSLLLCCALVATFGAAAVAAGLVLEVPADLLTWVQTADKTAPRLQQAARELAAAQSLYRAGAAAASGSTLLLTAPLQVTEEGAGAGVQLNLRTRTGGTVTTAAAGVVQAFAWDGTPALVPALSVRVTHPLYHIPDTEAAARDLELAAAQAAYRDAVAAWQAAVLAAYAKAQTAALDRQVAADRLELARMRLAVAEARAREGASTPADVHTARLAVAQAEAELLKADLAVEKALIELERLAGKRWEGGLSGPATPVTPILLYPEAPAVESLEAWVAIALDRRSDLQLAAERVLLAERELARARRSAGLSGSLEGGLTFPQSADSGEPSLGWYIGATWTLPLRDVSAHEAVVRAELNLEQAVAARDELEEKIRTDVYVALRELQLAEDVLARLEGETAHARQMLDLAVAAWEDGLGTELDVYNARIGLGQAERAAVEARYDVLLKRAALWRTVGGEGLW